MLVGVVGCGDDGVGVAADGTGSTGDSGSTTEEPSVDSSGAADGDAGGPCTADDECDDGDPCTVDVCNAGTCEAAGPVLSNECRPIIEVDHPPRGATLRSAEGLVTVAGSVSSGAGSIQWLRINGEEAPLDESGRFSYDVAALTGGNTLVLTTMDEHGIERTRVQSFVWSTEYHQPATGDQGKIDHGLAVYLDQQALDDGDHSEPVNDMATLMGLALGAVDLGAFIDPTVPMADVAGYQVYVLGLDAGSSDVTLTAIDGGMQMVANIGDVVGQLDFQGLSSSPGQFTVENISATVDLFIDVDENNNLAIAVLNPVTEVQSLDLSAEAGGLNFLLTLVQPFIIGGVVADLEAELTTQLTSLMGPAVGLALQAMAPNTTMTFPQVGDGKSTNDVRLSTDFHEVRFDDGQAPPEGSPSQGGLLVERAGARALDSVTPYENGGVPLWNGCGAGPQPLVAHREAPVEIVLTDDLLNQMLYGAWEGGMLEFEMPPELLGDDDGLISELEVRVSGMLAPTASDCGPDGRLRMYIGDIRIEGSLVLGEQPITFVAYSSLVAGLDVVPTKTGIGITLGEVERIDTELSVGEDEAIETEATLIATLESQLIEGVLGSLSADGLGEIALPQLDLSGTLGLPPGTAAVQVVAEQTERADGVTIIDGRL